MVRAGFLFDWIELHLESKQGMKFFATVLVSFFVFAIEQAFNLLLALTAPIIIGAVIGVAPQCLPWGSVWRTMLLQPNRKRLSVKTKKTPGRGPQFLLRPKCNYGI